MVPSTPAPTIYERFLHNPGWGSKLDAPLMSQVNDHWDDLDSNGDPIAPIWQGAGAHFRTFIQDAAVGGGNVIAVKDNTLQHTTVRISYSPTGEPILDSYYSGADFDRNGGIDGVDLASFFTAYEPGHATRWYQGCAGRAIPRKDCSRAGVQTHRKVSWGEPGSREQSAP